MIIQNCCKFDRLGQCALAGSLLSVALFFIPFTIAYLLNLRHPMGISFCPDLLDQIAGWFALVCLIPLAVNSYTQPFFALLGLGSIFHPHQKKWISLLAFACALGIWYLLHLE